MALNAYLKLAGAVHGQIKGGSIQKGREQQIVVIGYNHEIISPRDAATGQATGKRQHLPLTIIKEIDKSSPLLLSALATNEKMTDFQLRFYTSGRTSGRVGATGAEVNHFTITLQDATISAIKSIMLNNKVPEFLKRNEYEEISFVYKTITWLWTEGNLESSDEWDMYNER